MVLLLTGVTRRMQSVFGFHDPTRAKAFCYATTASDKSSHREQIEREAPVFRDVSSWSTESIVDQIVQDEIHILVNLNGYTRGARNEIFAARPAPIQMSFMGFAGTLGAEWCDYLLADETAVPPSTLRPVRNNINLDDVFHDEELADDNDWMYSENIIYCRDTFFCCDHAQSSGPEERVVTWHEEQHRRWKMRKELFPNLPDDTIILGNFNQLYKVTEQPSPPPLSSPGPYVIFNTSERTELTALAPFSRLTLPPFVLGCEYCPTSRRPSSGFFGFPSWGREILDGRPSCGLATKSRRASSSRTSRQNSSTSRGPASATCSWTRLNATHTRLRRTASGPARRYSHCPDTPTRCARGWRRPS